MKNPKTMGALMAVAFLASATSAFAQEIRLEVDANATGGGAEVRDTSATSSGTGGASLDANTSIDDALADPGATATGSFNTINGNTTRTSATTTFTITRSDLRDDTATTTDPSMVASRNDFESYARAVMASDENVVRIESGEYAVSVWYREPAKFLGLIPVMVSAKATVTNDGIVSVSYPWWYSVFVKDEDPQGLERSLSTTAGTIARAETGVELSSSVQARLVNALRSGMKEYHEATVSTGTSTDMTAE